jgi:hypothetical protein
VELRIARQTFGTDQRELLKELKSPKLPAKGEVRVRVDAWPAQALWTKTRPLELTPEVRKAAHAGVREVFEALRRGDLEKMFSLMSLADAETMQSLGQAMTPEMMTLMKEELKKLAGPAKRLVVPGERDLELQLVGGKHLIRVTAKSGKPLLELAGAAGEGMALPALYFGEVDGALRVVRK